MPEEPHEAAHTPRVLPEVHTEDGGLPRHHGHQPGQRPEEGGLAGAVRPAHEHDLTGVNLEVDASQCREAIEEADRSTKANDRAHGVLATLPAAAKDDQGAEPAAPVAATGREPRPTLAG